MSRVTHNTNSDTRPDPCTLQWHITNRCNWRCTHCYHDTYAGDELNLAALRRIGEEFFAFTERHGMQPEFTITGGEPFVRHDFIDLLAHLSDIRPRDTGRCIVATNGSLLTDDILDELRVRAPIVTGIQISLEGNEKTNDAIRGAGSFETIVQAAHRAKTHGFRVSLAATVSRKNYREITDLIDLLAAYQLTLSVRRFVPIGIGRGMSDELLTPDEMHELYTRVHALNAAHTNPATHEPYFRTSVCTGGIQFADWSDGRHRTCGVRKRRAFNVMPNGDVYPCRLLPVNIGNITHDTFEELYTHGYAPFTQKDRQDTTCTTCPVYGKCQGGAPCISRAVTGDFYARDPQCWRPITTSS